MPEDSLPEKLRETREAIDKLDDDIVDLLERRAALAKNIGEQKRAAGQGQYAVPEREAEVLRRALARSRLLRDSLPAIYREIVSACLACEKPAAVAYLGPQGTYSHAAALKMFGQSADLAPVATIGAAIVAAESGRADFAVVPFENSATGAVGETLDRLAETSLQINGEYVMRVDHLLLGAGANATFEKIQVVRAHPQALEQCRDWLSANLPRAARRAADSTAAAAEAVKSAAAPEAAIGSALARDLHGLTELAADIADFRNNSTRFLALSRREAAPTGADKTSFIMTTRDEAGAMHRALEPMAQNGVSMTKLESRPSRGRLWEYLFFIDVLGHRRDAAVSRVLEGIRARAASLKILGSYPRADG